MRYGDPDGHGTYGRLTTGDAGGLICHECGQERQFLGRHIREHGITADQYRERHGLGRSTPLASPSLQRTFSELATERIGSPGWVRFEAARDTDTARRESMRVWKEAPPRPEVHHALVERGAAASRSRPPRTCEVDGCGRKHVANGLCRTHRERLERTGDVQAHIPVRPRQGGPPSERNTMQITPLARKITRTLNAECRDAARPWVVYLNDKGEVTHRHQPGCVSCTEEPPAHIFDIHPGGRYTQRQVQEQLLPGSSHDD